MKLPGRASCFPKRKAAKASCELSLVFPLSSIAFPDSLQSVANICIFFAAKASESEEVLSFATAARSLFLLGRLLTKHFAFCSLMATAVLSISEYKVGSSQTGEVDEICAKMASLRCRTLTRQQTRALLVVCRMRCSSSTLRCTPRSDKSKRYLTSRSKMCAGAAVLLNSQSICRATLV